MGPDYEVLAKQLYLALIKTKDVVKSWHGPEAFEIYVNMSPEMKPYRDAIRDFEHSLSVKEKEEIRKQLPATTEKTEE